jgi:hypothetical protein
MFIQYCVTPCSQVDHFENLISMSALAFNPLEYPQFVLIPSSLALLAILLSFIAGCYLSEPQNGTSSCRRVLRNPPSSSMLAPASPL